MKEGSKRSIKECLKKWQKGELSAFWVILKKSGGGRGGAQPSPRGRLGGGGAPPHVIEIASVTSWIAAAVGVPSARTKDGMDVPVEVNYDGKEYREKFKLSEPVIWDITREFPEDAQKIGMDRKMNSMREFNVYTDVPIEQTTQEQRDSAIDLKWVKRWKTESELRMRLVACGCFQEASKLDSDTLYASTPSLVTLRLMLVLAIARGWSIALADISTAFLRIAL